MRLLLVVAAAALSGFVWAAPQQATGVITGVVVNEEGRPLASASVGVAGTMRGDRTDADGRFTITRVPPGTRVVRALSAGYREGTRRVEVVPGDTARTGFLLTTGPTRVRFWLIDPAPERVALGVDARAVTGP
jgi:hypothetical protein